MATTPPGQRLGRYHLIEPLGGGPCGEVYRAKVVGVAGMDRHFAVKRIHPSMVNAPGVSARLSQACRVYAGLDHPRIARLSELGVGSGETFTVTDLVAGIDLARLQAAVAQSGGQLAPGAALALVSAAARAVGYAHGRGVCHWGLSPTNLLATADGDVRVTDFGVLACRLGPRPAEDPSLRVRLPYLAPEQLLGEPVSPATDVFVLGVVAYELVAGVRPFGGATALELEQAVVSGQPAPLPLPRPVARVIDRCLARSPFERFPDARALADALDAALRLAPLPGERRDVGDRVREALEQQAQLHERQLSGAFTLAIPQAPAMLSRPKAPVGPVGQPPPSPVVQAPPKVPVAQPAQPPMVPPPVKAPVPARSSGAALPLPPIPGRPGAKPPAAPPPVPPRAARTTGPQATGAVPPASSVATAVAPVETSSEAPLPSAAETPAAPVAAPAAPTLFGGQARPSVAAALATGAPAARSMGPTATMPAQEVDALLAASVASAGAPAADAAPAAEVGVEEPPRRATPPMPMPAVAPPAPSIADSLWPGAEQRAASVSPEEADDVFARAAAAAAAEQARDDEVPLFAPPVTASPPPPPVVVPATSGPRRSRWPWLVLAALALAGASFAAVMLLKKDPDESAARPPVLDARRAEPTLAAGGDAAEVVAPDVDADVVALAPVDAGPEDDGLADAMAMAAVPVDAAPPPIDAARRPVDAAPAPLDEPPPVDEPVATGDTLVIDSQPRGARIYVDGKDVGRAPVTLPGSDRQRQVVAFAAGRALHTATVDGRGRHRAVLAPAPRWAGAGGIKVRCKARRYYVFVDGKDTGQLCPTERIGVKVGAHTVEVYDLTTGNRRTVPANVADTAHSLRVDID